MSMQRNPRRRRRRHIRPFLGFMLKYALIWIIAIFLFLEVFWIYIASYEKSQDTYAVNQYVKAIDEDYITSHSGSLLSTLDQKLEGGGQGKKDLDQLLLNHVEYSKKVAESTDSSSVFVLKAGDSEFGKLTYTKSEKKGLFGKARYELTGEEIDFAKLKTEKSVTIPSSWSVSFNGQTLDDSYISDANAHLDLLDQFYGDNDENPYGLPTLRTYTVKNVLTSGTFTCRDEDGKEQDPSDFDQNSLLTIADSTKKQEASDFIDDFLPAYIQSLSNSNHDALANYQALSQYMLDGSELDQRVYNAIEGQTWANSQGDTIQNTTINQVYDFGNQYLLADITYTLETIGTQGAVESTSNARVLIYRTKAGVDLAVDIASY
jgi:hypothetical protein